MWGYRHASRKRTVFALLSLFAGLYIVLAILPRRRSRRSASPHEGTSAPRHVAPVPTREPAAEPPSEEEPAELPFAQALSIPDPVAAALPPVAALADGRATRHARSRTATALVTVTLFAVLALIAAIPSAIGSHGSPFIDLTTVGANVTHDGVIFAAGVGPAGTGQFDPYLTVSPGGSTPTEVGYNSDGQGAGSADDDVFYGGGRTHVLRASAIPPTVVGGVEYREFSLDGNDQGSDDFMSIDNIEIYIDTEAGVKGYVDGAGCTPGTFSVNTGPAPAQIYCLDAGGAETILMRTQGLSSGSGQSDITVLIPASIFPSDCPYGSLTCNKWVTYYFEAGFAGSLAVGAGCPGTCNYDVSAGFEEWRTRKLPVVSVTKTVTASINRKFDWTVKKYVSTDDTCTGGFLDAQTSAPADALNIDLFNGQSDTVCWKIVSDRGEPTLSGGVISGSITIANPTGDPDAGGPLPQVIPPIDAVLNSITDVVDQGGLSNATVTCPFSFPHTLGPQDSVTCTYTKSTSSTTAGTNTAHAFVDNGASPDLDYASAAMPFTVTTTDEDETASLDDSRSLPGAPILLTGDDTRTYTESLACPSSRTELNTATLTETDTSTVHTDPANVNIVCSARESSTATQIHDVSHNVVTSVALGTTVHDRATVTGAGPTPTGTVTFTFFTAASDCTGASVGAGTVALVSGVAHPSDAEGPLAAGSYSFRAHYNGDGNFNESTSDCEPLTVTKADTTTATQIHDAAHNVVTSVPAGTTVHDRATVSESNPTFDPTGTVTFTFFTAASDCTGASVGAGTVALVSGVAHPSDAEGPLAAGSYSFRAHYNGDGNFNESTSACEPLEVTPVGEGCTPGYWKNHLDSWVATGFSPGQTLESVFDVPDEFGLDNVTLLAALDLGGGTGKQGAAQILLRAAVAALLNAAHPGVDYPLTTAQIISQVNTALTGSRAGMITLATTLDGNNNLGCPLN